MFTRADLRKALSVGSFPEGDEWFFQCFREPDGKFLAQEGDNYDFKAEWPFSYSDEYFCGLIKLVSAFGNSTGGIIVFNVNDETRAYRPSKVRINADKFIQSMENYLENPPAIELRIFDYSDGPIPTLIVPPKPVNELPSRFVRHLGNAAAGSIWVRVGHETVLAQPKHIPMLFCRSEIEDDPQDFSDSALPPSPATIKRFVGRLPTIYRIFEWLFDPLQPRAFLYGRGGSGKTSIAYEVAKHVSQNRRSIRFDRNKSLDNIIFISGKEREFLTSTNKQRQFVGRDFATVVELYESILALSGALDPDDLGKLTEKTLIARLKEFFDTTSALIVIDDIDTLTTAGLDAGFDAIYLILARARLPSKVLYTLRNAPTHSLANSIEVPGLQKGEEYSKFVSVCAQQFGVPEPSPAFRDGALSEVSERRPLIVETIIALRRHCGSYERSAEQFRDHAGDDARAYVFKREWDALPRNNYARYLLAILGLIGTAVAFEDIKAMIQLDDNLIVEALADAREMFIEVNEGGQETTFHLGTLTKEFVLAEAQTLDRFGILTARVDAFRKTFYPENPTLSRLKMKTDTLLREATRRGDTSYLTQAWTELTSTSLKASTTEDPRFREYRGYVATQIVPVRLTEAREDFRYAVSMNYEPDIDYLRQWYRSEDASGIGAKICDEIVAIVSKGRRYTEIEKVEFTVRRAGRLYARGRAERALDPETASGLLAEACLIHAKSYGISVRMAHPNLFKYEEYFRNTVFLSFNTFWNLNNPDDMISLIADMSKIDGVILDPIERPIAEYFEYFRAGQHPLKNKPRLMGRLSHLMKVLDADELWDDPETKRLALAAVQRAIDYLSGARSLGTRH